MNYLSTDTLYQTIAPSIDKENGILKNVLVVQEGEAKGHNLFLNQEFLENTAKLGNENTKGIKARFGHPNMCSTALGTYIGRYKNFRKQDTNVVADLYLDKSARIAPNGNLYDYILELAATNPDMFGSSIAFKPGKSTSLSVKDQVTEEIIELNYATIESLHAVDLVDEPAATNGLFAQFHQNDWVYAATLFFDDNPALLNVLLQNPYSYIEFINNYLNNNNMPIPEEFKKFKDKISDFFQKNNMTYIEPVEMKDLTTKLETLQTDLLNKDRLIQELQSNLTESITLGEALQSKIDVLSAKQSVPANLADPKININKGLNEEDTAGKQLLKELTYQDRMKLKAIQ
jgi:hypothetical protein